MPSLLLLPFILLLVGACGSEVRTVEGRLAEDVEVTHVWVVGGPEGSAVADGGFVLEDLSGDTLDLRFAREGEEVARMEIIGAPAGSRLALHEIWIDEETGTAYPGSVAAEAGGSMLVNGLRMADVEAIPEEFEGEATVLAVSRSADALLARPLDEALPDLRVVLTPGTLARTIDGEPASLEEIEFGDTIGLRGVAEQGFMVATEVTVPRERAGSGRVLDSGRASDRSAARRTSVERGREEEKEREKEREKDKDDKEKGKGRGRGG